MTTKPDFDLRQDLVGAWYLEGPADYMDARGADLMNAILDGSDALLDQLLLRHTDWTHAVLARFQLDYANWRGVNRLMDSRPVIASSSASASASASAPAPAPASAQPKLLEVDHQ